MRLRVRYSKLGKVRFISHRDTARVWERTLRRADVPVATSAGYTPRPRLSFGLALPTGAESVAEYLDLELSQPVDLEPLPARLTAALPIGLSVVDVVALADRVAVLDHGRIVEEGTHGDLLRRSKHYRELLALEAVA